MSVFDKNDNCLKRNLKTERRKVTRHIFYKRWYFLYNSSFKGQKTNTRKIKTHAKKGKDEMDLRVF